MKNSKEADTDEESEEIKAKVMFEEQNRIVDVELENISKTKNGKVGRVWAIRKKVIGRKKVDMLPSAIRDPATKKLVVNTTNIKETVLRYCVETLSNNEPEERFKEEIVKKKEYVTNRLDMIMVILKEQ